MQQQPVDNRTGFPWRALLLFFAILVVFGIVQVIAMELPILPQAAIIATQLIVILGGAILYRKTLARKETTWPSLKKLGMSPAAAVVVVAASVALGFLANAIGALKVKIFPELVPMAEAYQDQIELLLLPEAMHAQILGAIGVAVVAPFAEEILFRGTILAEQRRRQMAANAILLNGILFSMMHLNPVAFVSLAIVGCYFAHITLRSDSVWGAILGHAALNLVNGVVLLRVAADVAAPEQVTWGQIIIALAILVPVVVFLWWTSIRLMRGDDSADSTSEDQDHHTSVDDSGAGSAEAGESADSEGAESSTSGNQSSRW